MSQNGNVFQTPAMPTNRYGTAAYAKETRHQTQYWLNYNLDAFAQRARESKKEGAYYVDNDWVTDEIKRRIWDTGGYAGIITADYTTPGSFINKIVNKGNDDFTKLSPAQQSLLVPHFEVFLANEAGSQSGYVRLPITVPTIKQGADGMAQQGYGRPDEVAFLGFEWEDQGNAPGTVGLMYSAKLKLYFSSIHALTTAYTTHGGTTTFLQLISPTSETRNIGIICGWAIPPEAVDEFEDFATIRDAIERQRVAFDLNITSYDMSFTDNGGVNLDINYQLSDQNLLYSTAFDMLKPYPEIGWVSERATRIQEELDAAQASLSTLTEVLEGYQTAIEIWNTAYARLLDSKTGGDYDEYNRHLGLEIETGSGTHYTANITADGQLSDGAQRNATDSSEPYTPRFDGNASRYNTTWQDFPGWDSTSNAGGTYYESSAADQDEGGTTASTFTGNQVVGPLNQYANATQIEWTFWYYAARAVTPAINNAMTTQEKEELRGALDKMARGPYFTSEKDMGTSQRNGWLPVEDYGSSQARFRGPRPMTAAERDVTSVVNTLAVIDAGIGMDLNYNQGWGTYVIYSNYMLPINELTALQSNIQGNPDSSSAWDDYDVSVYQEQIDLLTQKKPLMDLADCWNNIYDKLKDQRAVYYVDVPRATVAGLQPAPDDLEVVQWETSQNAYGTDDSADNNTFDFDAATENIDSAMTEAERRAENSEDVSFTEAYVNIMLEGLNANTYTPIVDGNARISFFYLGDLLSIIYGIFFEQANIIIGPMVYSREGEELQSVNLADIPINYDSFSEVCVELTGEAWARGGRMPPQRFLDYVLEALIVDWKGMANGATLGQNAQSLAQERTGGMDHNATTVDIVQKPIYMEKDEDGNQPYKRGHRIMLDEEDIFPPFEEPLNRVRYMAIYASNNDIHVLSESPNEELDAMIPIFWLKYGHGEGIVKNITFSRMDMPGYAEGIAVEQAEGRSGDSAASAQSPEGANPLNFVFQASVTMLGNNLFENGQLVYLEPRLPGIYEATNELRFFLGIAGYYRVIKTSSVIEDGNYETTIDLIFTQVGGLNEQTTST